MRISLILFFLFIITGCQKKNAAETAQEMEIFKEYGSADGCQIQVYFFLQPDCPLSQTHTRTLAEIARDERFKDFCFTAFFSGKLYTREEYEYFIMHYPTPYRIRVDPKLQMAKSLDATVVPEVFVLNEKGEVLYEGAINDWAVREGGKRQAPQEHYLLNALISISEGEKPSVAKTTAVGCILQ